jgi:hypothetical protein
MPAGVAVAGVASAMAKMFEQPGHFTFTFGPAFSVGKRRVRRQCGQRTVTIGPASSRLVRLYATSRFGGCLSWSPPTLGVDSRPSRIAVRSSR